MSQTGPSFKRASGLGWVAVALAVAVLAFGGGCRLMKPKAPADLGWVPLFDGVSLTGWRASEHPDSFTVQDGDIVVHGDRAHLFYVGTGPEAPVFTDFELRAEILTRPRANSGIFIHTAYQDTGWPAQGIEVQVNNSYPPDPKRTGSLYNLANCDTSPVADDVWWEMHIVVEGAHVAVRVNGQRVAEYTQPADRNDQPRLSSGTIALQAHDPESEVHYRSVRLRRLAPGASAPQASVAAPAAVPAPPAPVPAPGEPIARLAAFDYAGPREALTAVEDQIAKTDPKDFPGVEGALLGILGSPTASAAARQTVCRLLSRVGSDASVPVLAGLLADADLAHPARMVLERLDTPASRQALRDAATRLEGPPRVGAVQSLGHLRDRDSVPGLVPLAGASDPSLAAVALRALGETGGLAACQALESLRQAAPAERRPAVTAALLQALERSDAEAEREAVLTTYRALYGGQESMLVRIAALEGLVRLEGEKAAPLILKALEESAPELQGVAAQYVRTLRGQGLTEAFAARLGQADPGVQASLLAALAGRGDPAAKPAVLQALKHSDRTVREAAAAALEALGSSADIESLARAAAKARGPERDVLCALLSRLPGDDMGPALLKALDQGDPGVRAAVVRALTIRREPGAAPLVLRAAGDKDAGVRREALAALPELADVSAFPRLLRLLVSAPSDADRDGIRDAFAGIGARATTPERGTDVLSGAAVTAMVPGVKVTVLRALGKLGGDTALWAVEDALYDPDTTVVDAAVRALCDWPDQAALARLMELAAEAPVETHRVLALRAAVRLLGLPGRLSLDEALARYQKALDLATRPDERKAVLAGLGGVADPRAGAMILPDVQNQPVRSEAAVALLTVARRTLGIDLEQAARFAAAAKGVPDEAVQAEAEAVRKLAEEMKQYLMSWQYNGPHSGPKREDLFAARFPPEEGKDKPEEWKPMPVGTNPGKPWLLDLKSTPGGDDRVAYLRTYVLATAAQPARLEVGTDDGVKAWVNGRMVHGNPAWRGVTPGQDQIPITLFPGWNTLMLKVINGGGDWGACARLVSRDGKPLEGVKAKAALTDEEAKQIIRAAPAELVLHWPLESVDGTTTADVSGVAGAGEVLGGPTVQPGVVGNCFAFDGVDDEVRLNGAKGLPVAATDAWSINAFVWIDQQIPELTILGGFGDAVSAEPRGCQRYLTKMREGIHFWGSAVDVNAGQPFDLGRWQMVTLTYDGREVALYKDAKRLFANPETLADAAGVVTLTPIDHWKKINRFAGKLDEFTLWRGALSQEQIETLAAPLKAGK